MGMFDDLSGEVVAPASKGGMFDDLMPAATRLTRTERVMKGMRDPFDGGAQLLTKALPSGVVEAGNSLNNWLADKTGLVGRLPEGGVDQQVRQQEAEYQARRSIDVPQGITNIVSGVPRQAGFDSYRVIGNVASPANLAIAARVPQAATLGGRVALGALGGGASAALNPITGEDFWSDKMTQVGTGAAFGAGMPLIASGIRSVISPKASTSAEVKLLENEGVQPTIGQTLGGWANRVEEKAMSVPVLGDMIAAARDKARVQFNKAAINRAVAPIGEKVDDVGQAGIKQAGDLLSKAYDDAINQVKVVKFDKQFGQDLGQLRTMAQNMTPEMAKRFNSVVDDVLQPRVSANGSMLGSTYKQVDSKLGQEAAKFAKSSDPLQQELGDAFKQLQSLLKDQASRSNPAFAEAMKKADKGWANLVRVEGAGKAALNSEGVFTPGQLNAAARQADSSVRGRSIGRGTALMQDLGNAGQTVLGNKVANSGTADRLMQLGAGGALFTNPLATLGLGLGGTALYTTPMQNALRYAVTARPQSAQAVGNALLQASPRLVPGAAQVGLGLLE